MDFIFMLTRQDQTVTDCLEVFEEIRPLGLGHVGFKDLGVDRGTLRRLTRAIKDSGALSYLEVVSTSREATLASARTAVEIGIDRLMGGTDVGEILKIVGRTGTAYYPFPGKPVGHPTKLCGTAQLIEEHCRNFLAMGCAGVDLLAYRATEAEPIELVKAARRGLGRQGYLICAGSVDSPMRIHALKQAGCDAFTIGSAAFDGSFSMRKGRLASQLQDIVAAAA